MDKTNNRNSVAKNVLILSLAILASKVIGAIYQIYLPNTLGPEFVGLYTKGVNFYALILAIGVSGLPVAISKLTAEKRALKLYRDENRIFRISIIGAGIIGLIFSGLLYFGSGFISIYLYHDPRVEFIFKALAPAIIIVSIVSVLRGYFQGKEKMEPTAFSQVLEQFTRVTFSIFATIFVASNLLGDRGDLAKIDAVSYGALIGSVFALLVLGIYYFKYRKNIRAENIRSFPITSEKSLTVVKKILLLAIPIMLAAAIPTLIENIDGMILPRLLGDFGLFPKEADRFFALFSSYVMVVVNLVTLIASSFGIALVPAISAGLIKGDNADVNNKIVVSIKSVLLFVLPASIGIGFLGGPLLAAIFNQHQVGYILSFTAILPIFMSLYFVTTGILQGLNKIIVPVVSLGIGVLFNLLVIIFLVPRIGVIGAPISHTIGYILAVLINFWFIKKITKCDFKIKKWLWKTVVAGTITGVVSYTLYSLLSIVIPGISRLESIIMLLLVVGISAIVYVLLIILLKVFNDKEMRDIPKLGKVLSKIDSVIRGGKNGK